LNARKEDYEHLGKRDASLKPGEIDSFHNHDNVSISVVEESVAQSVEDELMEDQRQIEEENERMRLKYPEMHKD